MRRPRKPLYIEIPGTPKAKPRMTQRDKFLPSKSAQQYFGWADHVRICARLARREQGGDASLSGLLGPIGLHVVFSLPLPKSLSKAERARRLSGPHLLKPDLKNLIAGLEDALNKVLWADDAQIDRYTECRKIWTTAEQGLTQLTLTFSERKPISRPQTYPQVGVNRT